MNTLLLAVFSDCQNKVSNVIKTAKSLNSVSEMFQERIGHTRDIVAWLISPQQGSVNVQAVRD